MNYKLEGYQKAISDLIVEKGRVGIFARMGCGKTLATLDAIYRLMYDSLEVKRVLVIAPKRVAEYVWSGEIEKWGFGFTYAKAIGAKKVREAAIQKKADITIINRENVPWVIKNFPFEWDMVVIDESSSFKSHNTQRFRAMKAVVDRYKKCVLLSGTPAPRGYQNLWSQIYLLDRGQRLSPTITSFRYIYLTPEKTNGAIVYSYKLREGAKEKIDGKLSDICFGLTGGQDCIKKVVDVKAVMDTRTRNLYTKFKKDQILDIDGGELTAVTAGVLSNKLLQFASGAIYTENPAYYVFHHFKLDLLQEIIDSEQGQNILVFYNYLHEKDRLMSWFKEAEELDVEKWNKGLQPLALAHPASCGHGLNLQDGGHICVWFSPTFDLELYEQANARLARKGQENEVTIYRLLLDGSRDMQAVKALENKGVTQEDFINSVRLDLGLK